MRKINTKTSIKFMSGVVAIVALAVVIGCGSSDEDSTINIGALATLEGAFTTLGQDGIRGVELALQEFDYTAGGKELVLTTGSSDATPDSAIRAARNLVEQDGVDILIGPLSGSEGLALKDYAKDQPDVTFLNGASAAQDTTLRDPAPNFFRFSTDGAQWMAGLGEYVYNTKGYRNVSIIAEDYSFPYTQVQGFLLPYCELGGSVSSRHWTPIGTQDYSSIISALPADIDAIYVALGGADAVNFLRQYEQAGEVLPIIGGSITVDQSVLSSEGRTRESVIGTPSSGPIADTLDTPEWEAFVQQYRDAFPDDGFPSPSLFAHAYYVNTKAALLALDLVDGDLSDGGENFRATLSALEFSTPTGTVSIDDNRNAIADIYLTEVIEGPDGNLINNVIEVTPQVNQTLGIPEATFLEYGAVGRENPSCN